MKLINTIQLLKISTIDKRYLQFIAHWIYILLSLELYRSHEPFYTFLISYLCVIVFFYLGKKYIKGGYFDHTYLSILLVANSTYLNILYDYNYPILLIISVIVALNVKLFFRRKNEKRTMLNPSLAGIFILSMIFPQFFSYGANLWSSLWWQLLIVLIVGSYVTFRARTLLISISYLISYLFFSLLIGYILTFLNLTGFIVASPLSWVLTLFSVGKLIFIFHVISDPQSGPRINIEKIIFGASIGGLEILFKYFNILNNVILSYIIVLTALQIYEFFVKVDSKKYIISNC